MTGTAPGDRSSAWNALRERKVVQWTLAYVAVAFALVQGIDLVAQQFGLGDAVRRAATILLATGLPISIVLAWFHGERGAQRVSVSEVALILALLVVGVALAWRYAPGAPQATTASGGSGADAPATAAHAAGDGTIPFPDSKSIAVLPFVNMSSDKEQEYFSDGVSEELLNLLTKIPELQVTARTSSFSFKGRNLAIPEIAKALQVAHVLQGSVRRAGDKVRITSQLVRADNGTQLWSETYDRKLDDIFAIQDEIAADVVKQLKVTLLGVGPKVRTTDAEAYALFLQATQVARRRNAEAIAESDALLDRFLAIDPRYAPAWGRIARNWLAKASLGLTPIHEAYAKAREATIRALDTDPDYAPALSLLGRITNDADNDPAGAARHLERALEVDRNDPDVLSDCSVVLGMLDRLDDAMAVDAVIVRRDPINVRALYNLAYHQRLAGRLDEAIATYRTILKLAPDIGGARADLANALLLKGDARGAQAEIEEETSGIWKAIGLPMVYHALGRKAESDAAVAALALDPEKGGPYNIAYVHAFRGDADKAFEWLGKAAHYGGGGLSEITSENLFGPIRSDPRWLPFLRSIGKDTESLAKIEFKVTLPQ